ncbi:91_t:CDS:10 [Ambispora gerdemannii]|uniref:91_t:CDS:1 n=1 Tax=Ambispora gerdemannii TaxID=144530 RepID=A0A9N8Z0K1_9GLOM|nr:91_t:CDS:10 [Ambispora gerdemannii]
MKLIKKHIERDRSGYVVLYPEELEDMWHVYNLVSVGDQLKATTIRHERSVDSQRVRLTLKISVDKIDFDPQGGLLRIRGRNVMENKYVKMGMYHTIDLELNRNFTLIKGEWDIIALERVEEACDVTKTADVAAVVLQEGLANVCLVTQNMTIVRQRIESPVPRKRKGSVTNYEKGLYKFYEQVMQSIIRHVNFDVVKVVIIASPGFVKDQLFEYVFAEAVSQLADTKYAQEMTTLDKFFKMLNDDPDRAFYGWEHVSKAGELGAIGTLMLSDELFRSADIATRKKYIELVKSIRSNGGKVLIFSSLHVSGENLNQLTGVAAILTFPVPDIEEEELNNTNNNGKSSS